MDRNLPPSEYRNSALWSAVDAIIEDLCASGEMTLATAPDYVTAQICRELVGRKLVASSALEERPGRGDRRQ
jgi:hypothetical protein